MQEDSKTYGIRGLARLVVGVLVHGCGPGSPAMPGEGSGSSEATGSTTVGPTSASVDTTGVPTSGSPTTTGGMSATTGTETGQGFITGSDAGTGYCDAYTQDCRPGQKCMPYADDGGGSWNALKCVPVMEDPAQVGESCFVVDNGVSGIDNCELGAMCWDTDAENMGMCVALCAGSIEMPMCELGFACESFRSAPFGLCIAQCDPLEQDCEGGDVCIGSPSGDGFVCVLDASGGEGQAHDPCMFANSCDPGLLCLNADAAAECDPQVSGCCEPFCDLEAPNTCPGAGQVCNPYFEAGTAPPGDENVGYCAIPM